MNHAPKFWADKLQNELRGEFWGLVALGFSGETAYCRITDKSNARYSWLRTAGAWESEIGMDELSKDPDKFDAAVDAAMKVCEDNVEVTGDAASSRRPG